MPRRRHRSFPTWLTWLTIVLAAVSWTHAIVIVKEWYR